MPVRRTYVAAVFLCNLLLLFGVCRAQGIWRAQYLSPLPTALRACATVGDELLWLLPNGIPTDTMQALALGVFSKSAKAVDFVSWPDGISCRGTLSCLYLLEEERLWAAGHGALLRSADAGRHWDAVVGAPSESFDYRALSFVDSSHGVALGFAEGFPTASVAWTNDGGTTWDLRHSLQLIRPLDVAAVDETTAVAAGGATGQVGLLLRLSESRGVTVRTNWPTPLARLARASAQLLFTVSEGGDVLRSSDQGVTWERVATVPETANGVSGFAFADSLHGLLACGRRIFRTADGGYTWEAGPQWFRDPIVDVAFPAPEEAWAVSSGQIWRSADGGRSWEPQLDRPRTSFGSISFVTPRRGLVSGTYLFRTEDGGESWTRVDTLGGELAMVGPDTGYLLDGYRGLLRTEDGGLSWAMVDTGLRGYDGLYASPSGRLFVWKYDPATRESRVLVSQDGGATWDSTRWSGYEVRGFCFVDSGHRWAFGAAVSPNGEKRPVIWRTVDGGETWNPSEPPAGRWAAGPVADVAFASVRKGWAVDVFSKIWVTEDGGATWTLQYEEPDAWFRALAVVDTSEVWACGAGILRSEDGGRKWEAVGPDFVRGAFLTCASFPQRDVGFFAGESVILRWTSSTGVYEAHQSRLPTTETLTCYPNPFNEAVHIVVLSDHFGPVNVSVFDVHGRLISSIFEGTSKGRKLVLSWDARDESGRSVPSGVYICRAVVNGRVVTRKLALLK